MLELEPDSESSVGTKANKPLTRGMGGWQLGLVAGQWPREARAESTREWDPFQSAAVTTFNNPSTRTWTCLLKVGLFDLGLH